MAYWIWEPGSLELWHGMLLHNRRTTQRTYNGETRSVYYHPMWRVDAPRHNTVLFKKAVISEPEVLEFYSNTEDASITVDQKTYTPGTRIELDIGEHTVYLKGFKREGFPAFYIKGKTFESDRSWRVKEDDDKSLRHAGFSELYTSLEDDVLEFKFSYKEIKPTSTELVNGGILYDFGKESFGKLSLNKVKDNELLIACGESREEALDYTNAIVVINAKIKDGAFESKPVAFRYVYIPCVNYEIKLSASLEYLPLDNIGSFKCSNSLVNDIWQTCAYTMLLNSREAFFDGIKRDRWVWSGDAYQSFFVNYYLYLDRDIVRRTIRMLRGASPTTKHINTICDYTFYWIISIWEYYIHTGDRDFINDIYPEMLDIWSFVESRLDKNGMYQRIPDDWVFIDWSTFDSNGPICAEQLLLARAYECLSRCSLLNGYEAEARRYMEQSKHIVSETNRLYWCEEKGAFVDDYKSGRRNVTRHANIFACLFDYTTSERKESIIKNVIYNKEITPITTPYFEFFELDAMCQIGDFKYMTDMLDSYWGGMLRLGATTIWEEFDPTKKGIEHYEMYGGKYEKSLCHAWGASPIYLLGKYALGVKPIAPGYESYEIKPSLMGFEWIEGTVPVPNGAIYIKQDKEKITVKSSIAGGTLIVGEKKYDVPKGKELTVKA